MDAWLGLCMDAWPTIDAHTTKVADSVQARDSKGGEHVGLPGRAPGPNHPALMVLTRPLLCVRSRPASQPPTGDDDVSCLSLQKQNRSQAPYTFMKVRTIRGCIEGLALMI
jgi:hypothetical protein